MAADTDGAAAPLETYRVTGVHKEDGTKFDIAVQASNARDAANRITWQISAALGEELPETWDEYKLSGRNPYHVMIGRRDYDFTVIEPAA